MIDHLAELEKSIDEKLDRDIANLQEEIKELKQLFPAFREEIDEICETDSSKEQQNLSRR